MRLLVVDDDDAVRAALQRGLRLAGHEVVAAPGGSEALQILAKDSVDAVLLDVRMPHPDGLTVCRTVRRQADRTPILMLTAADAIADRVEGLDAGADDYLVKPFAFEELLARLKALTRRDSRAGSALTFGDLRLDSQTRTVWRGARQLSLTVREYELLRMFLENPRIVLTRGVIYEGVWGHPGEFGSNTLDVFVSGLRRKLEAEGGSRLVHTVRGVGFVLR
ncbi:MAG: response regulator transcription factor [Actinomycetales bacterium]